jgi:DNA-binding SARP family transcriptional activator
LPLGGPQQRAVLAILLTEADSTVSIHRLADALWGDRVPAGFAATVQTYVFHLRQVLEPDRRRGAAARLLITELGGYRLHTDDGAVDAARFERQVRAGQDHLARNEYAEAEATLSTRWNCGGAKCSLTSVTSSSSLRSPPGSTSCG